MKKINLYITLFLFCAPLLNAQNPNGNYNPFVKSGTISPSPLFPTQVDGKGTISFDIGNTGSDPLEVYPNHHLTLTITLSYGVPEHADPITAVAGSSAGLFTWSYNEGTYSAVQTSTIPANSSGTITIDYKVNKNSDSPGLNGFNVNISPAPYQTETNTQDDDAVNSYTYTEIRDYGDAPASYGSVDHLLDFENYLGSLWDGEIEHQFSASADGDDNADQNDEDGVSFPDIMRQGDTAEISVRVKGAGYLNAWIDWNGDGDFNDENEQLADNLPVSEGTHNLEVIIPEDAITSLATFARFRLSSETLSGASGSANGGEVEDYVVSIFTSSGGVDTEAPSVPTGLQVAASSLDSITISWSPSTDNMGVKVYKVYRDESVVGTSFTSSYTDHSVTPNSTYSYDVTALDAAGNESEHCDPVVASAISTAIGTNKMGDHALKMYPNPTKGLFELEIFEASGEYTLVIFNSVGKFVENKVIYFNASTYSLDLGHLKSGVYNINLYNDRYFYYGKLMINK